MPRAFRFFLLVLGVVSACAPNRPRAPSAALSAEPSLARQSPASTPAPRAAFESPRENAVNPAPAAESPVFSYPDRPLPEGFVYPAETGKTVCGDFSIEHVEESEGVRFIRVFARDGKKRYEAHGRYFQLAAKTRLRNDLALEFCGDLTLDGIPELVLTEKTIGAHCCYTHYVVSLTSPIKRLLFWEKGDAGTPLYPARYRPGAAWQVEARVVFWPPFRPEQGDPVLAYAFAPLIPAVFSLVGDQYRLMSLAFPEAYRRDREAIRASCRDGAWGCDGELIEWIDSLVLGDWDEEKAHMTDEELRTQLDRRSRATKQRLLVELGSLRRPARTR